MTGAVQKRGTRRAAVTSRRIWRLAWKGPAWSALAAVIDLELARDRTWSALSPVVVWREWVPRQVVVVVMMMMMMRFAFLGRVSMEDLQDPVASRQWQLSRAEALVAGYGRIVAEFFDVGQSRSVSWLRRRESARLLAALEDPDRSFEAVVIGEPQRVFYDNQLGLIFPLFEHFEVGLWVPEVGGPIDPDSEAHNLIMSVYAGMSKAETAKDSSQSPVGDDRSGRVRGAFSGRTTRDSSKSA